MRYTANARFVKNLEKSEPLLGTMLSLPSPEVAEVMTGAGFDWLFIDLEHGLLDFRDAQRMVQAAGGCPCIIRVPSMRAIEIAKALDVGAAGVILPHVNSADAARAFVQAARYPPEGLRSIGVARAQGYGRTLAEEVAFANQETAVVAQVEHIDGVRNIEQIVAVPGVDAVFVGPFDLSASMGKPGKIGDADVRDAIARVLDACLVAGKPCGTFVVDPSRAREAFQAGYSLVCLGTDALILGKAAADAVRSARS